MVGPTDVGLTVCPTFGIIGHMVQLFSGWSYCSYNWSYRSYVDHMVGPTYDPMVLRLVLLSPLLVLLFSYVGPTVVLLVGPIGPTLII